jgi:hypothetical protein
MTSSNNSSFNIGIAKAQIPTTLGVLLSGYAAIASFQSDSFWVSLTFIFFLLLPVYLLLFFGKIHIDDKVVRHSTLVGTYEISWDEIKEIQHSQGVCVLIGEQKQIAVTDVQYWSGSEKDAAAEFYWNQIDNRGVKFTETAKALFKLSKNSRIN